MSRPRILLIAYDNDAHIPFFPMGLAALAASCRYNGYEVKIYNQDVHHYPPEHLTEYLNRNHFDIVGLSFIGAYYPYRKAKEIAAAIHACKTPPAFVIGGHGPSPEPAYFLRLLRADYVAIGEGEAVLIELLQTLQYTNRVADIRNLGVRIGHTTMLNPRRDELADVDSLPLPAYDLFPMEVYRTRRDAAHPARVGNRFSIPLLSGRGCKFHCNFCYRIDKGMRLRSPERIVEEMDYLYRRWDIRHFMFYDDLLMESEGRTIELCEAFIRSGPPDMTFICQGRLNYATPEVLEMMKRAGCAYIYYGIESFNDDMLRVMRKGLTCDTIERGVENTHNAGIQFSPNMIFGNIGETREHLQRSVDFLLKWDDCAQIRAIKPVTPYPGSPLYDYAVEQGLLEGPADFYERKHKNTDLLTVNFTPLSDDEFYDALHEANRQILGKYVAEAERRNRDLLRRLYCEKDASFRGFRHV